MLLRHERPSDDPAIYDLTTRAFAPMAYSDGTEALITRLLRNMGDLTMSIVAEENGAVVGHIAFSPLTIGGVHEGWFGLGPIAVEPSRQRCGIGKLLVLQGLEALGERGAVGVALIGSPKIYRRMGFESDGLLTHANVDPRLVQRVVFSGPSPKGEIRFAAAFGMAAAK